MGNSASTTLHVAQIKKYSKKIIKQHYWSVADQFQGLVNKHPDKVLFFGNRQVSYTELDKLSNKIANWGVDIGLTKGDIIPLMLDNCPEFIAVWLGLAKIGVAAALINTNLSGNALKHCLQVALEQSNIHAGQTYTVIIGDNYVQRVTEIKSQLNEKFNVQFCSYTTHSDPVDTNSELVGFNRTINDRFDTLPDPVHRKDVTFNDPVFFIYTSGTTGLPKAAKISHLRFGVAGYAFKKLYGVNNSDSVYIPLPLYHSNGGMLAVSLAWHAGANIALRNGFSASNYFPDCQKYGCTVGVYIGEICRYIAKTKPSENDHLHPVRLMIGNGLRPDIWGDFVKRFGVTMGEFYGSTEGNANIFNTTGKIGAIGYLPWLLRKIYPVKIVKFCQETETLVRNEKGLCQECNVNEVGEAIGLIKDDDATRKFDGYTDRSATQKKIATNVLANGDKWFRTGDLLRMDKEGYVYFVDRIGDTFRWKGENVATTEVSEVVTKTDGILDSNVYGVTVPGAEGRIGMAAIRLMDDETLNVDLLYERVNKDLPKYARPHFLRILQQVDMTGTFKYKKVELRNDGFNPDTISDQLYMINDQEKTYTSLTAETYAKIVDGSLKL